MFSFSGTFKQIAFVAAGGAAALILAAATFVLSAGATTTEDYAPVLAPEQFAGEAAMGYAAASSAPKICAKLFCYCGCDSTDNHTNLLDCFTSTHGSDCHICQEEALMALRMQKEGKSLKEIQKSVDDTYAHMYPFRNPTSALKKYRAHKLYAGEAVRGALHNVQDNASDALHDAQDKAGVQPGATVALESIEVKACPSCCSRHNN